MERMIPENIEIKISEAGIIAVLVIENPENAVVLAKTLLNNGISAMELTLRTEKALESLKRIKKEVPEMMAGVGTILNQNQISDTQKYGAAFGVAPGYNAEIVEKAKNSDFPFAPGISTPSELEGAVSQGCHVLKYFHAENLGGTKYLKGINAPYSFLNLKYIPLGGLSLSNMRGYLELPEILALGGSWIAPKALIDNRDWDTIGKNAAEAEKIFREVRG